MSGDEGAFVIEDLISGGRAGKFMSTYRRMSAKKKRKRYKGTRGADTCLGGTWKPLQDADDFNDMDLVLHGLANSNWSLLLHAYHSLPFHSSFVPKIDSAQ